MRALVAFASSLAAGVWLLGVSSAYAEGNDAGRAVFAARCAVCHQAGGRGMDGLAPPLTEYPARFAGSAPGRKHLIETLLHGMYGDISVNGKHYNFRMPAFNSLGDEEIANVLNYLAIDLPAGASGPRAAPVGAQEVAALRGVTLDGDAVRRQRAELLHSLGVGTP
ncbi:gluconate 2-dehydrogenase (acceptor) [Pandoraea terrae]|uniref:Gluconate 2-dehydrogenase (Acceptor) n=1 Tax=Pandoraea terrae TaxID=1537710 RepID=A0A5E4RQY1_9BURK|nr:cytochrome c [Pandoraea terrae]VVD65435.1 gluconate 2-dehydrogenase (acceptor) [Pandoraea terrae]